MPTAVIDGIATRYEVTGDGPPLLMFSPGGFNATLDNWTPLGLYPRLGLLDQLARGPTPASRSTGASRAAPAAGWSGSPGPTTPRRARACSTTSASSART